MDLEPGSTIAGYEIGELLGRGGQSRVFRALDLSLRRTVALKVLPEGAARDEIARKRLLLEARAASALSHPGIATIYQVGEAGGTPFISMEYVEGESLFTRLLDGPLPLAEAVSLMLQIVDAVAYAHRKGVLHRDLKPGNVVVTPEGRVKLLDFGLAKLVSDALRQQVRVSGELTGAGLVVGTASYLSPEQAQDRELDARSDLFSLGVVFYELLSGRPPFERSTPAATMLAILAEAPPPFPEERAVPEEVARLVFRLLEKSPDRRPASAPELLDEIRGVARRLGIPLSSGAFVSAGSPARTVAGGSPAPQEEATHRLGAARPRGEAAPARGGRRVVAIAAAAAALLAVIVGVWHLVRRPGPPARRDAVAIVPLKPAGEADHRNLASLVSGQIIESLSRAPGLRVVLVPEGVTLEAATLERLAGNGVRWVLDGTVFLATDGVTVTLTMREEPGGRVVWAKTARGRNDQALSLGAQMASEAGGATGIAVDAARLDFPDEEVFDAFVKGNQALQSYDPRRIGEAVAHFTRCVERAPSFFPPYPLLVRSLLQYRNMGVDYDPAFLDRAHEVVRRGLAIDASSPELTLSLGWYRLYTYDFAGAHRAVDDLGRVPGGETAGCKLALWDQFFRGDTRSVDDTLPRCRASHPFDPSLELNAVVLTTMLGRAGEVPGGPGTPERFRGSTMLAQLAHSWRQMAEGRASEAAAELSESFRERGEPIVGMHAAQVALVAGDSRRAAEGFGPWLWKNPYSLEAHWLVGLAHDLSGDGAQARQAAARALRWASDLERRYPNPTTRLFRLYFAARAGDPGARAAEAAAVDPSGEATLTAYLREITLARLGERRSLDSIPTPYSPTFWLNRFAPMEVDLVRAAAAGERAGRPVDGPRP